MGDRPESVNDAVLDGDIRADIQQTRVEIAETMGAIQERLRPRNVVAQAGETVKDATVGRVKEITASAGEMVIDAAKQTREVAGGTLDRVLSSGWVQRVRENPVPAILASIGLACLASPGFRRALRRGVRSRRTIRRAGVTT
jgi:hypothetical protein